MSILDKLASANKGDNFRVKDSQKKYGDAIALMNRESINGKKPQKEISVAEIQRANKNQESNK